MKAAVLRGAYQLSIEDVPKPEVPAGHVLVNVKASAICGTDVGIYKGKAAAALPIIQGHESTGKVVEVGEGVTELKVGDRVVLNSVIFCRHCSYCYKGKGNLCPNGGLMGREINGTFAEYVVIPDFNAIKMPDSISYEQGTNLIALATVFLAHDKINIVPGQSVAVIGQGAAGLMQSRVSVLSGASPVYAVTRSQWKLDIAEKYGAIPVNASKLDPVKHIIEETGGEGVDIAIECVGSSATLRQAMDVVKPGGTVLFYGIGSTSLDNFNSYAMYYKELNIIGSRGMNHESFNLAIKSMVDGKFDGESLITQRFSLDDIKDALDLVDQRPGDVLRVVVSH